MNGQWWITVTLKVTKLPLTTLPLPLLKKKERSYRYNYFKNKVLSSDVARPLSYKTKTKTTFSRPRPLFSKTIKLLTQDHWRSQTF